MDACYFCDGPLTRVTNGRPQTDYCSRKCKDGARTLARQAERMAARVDRKCEQCGGPIPIEVNARARTCSRSCGVALQNRIKQDRRDADWAARKQPCGSCGGEIPADRHAGSRYCSPKCKKDEMGRRWREKSGGYMRQYLYGLTPERYADLLAEQDCRCAICRTNEPGGQGGWHVDHDHDGGKVRGLLCNSCNVGLGHFKDDPARLRAAADYLEAHAS